VPAWQRCAWTVFWILWNRTPAVRNKIRSDFFSAAPGSWLDLDFILAEKTLLFFCLTSIKPESNRIRIVCFSLVPDTGRIWI